MNFSQVGVALNMSRSGARSLVLRNKSKIKKYLIIKNKNIVGITDEGIEPLRQCCVKTPNYTEKLNSSNNALSIENEYLKKSLLDKDKMIELLQNQVERYSAELDYYRSLGFFQRLLGYKSNKK